MGRSVGNVTVPTVVAGNPSGARSGVSRRLDLQSAPIPEACPVESEAPMSHNPSISRGMRLSYIEPTFKNGTPTACLDQSAIDFETEKWKNAIILYVIGDSPSFTYLSAYVEKQWKVAKPEIFYHKKDYFFIRFASMEDRNRVLYSGPYTIVNKPVVGRGILILTKSFLRCFHCGCKCLGFLFRVGVWTPSVE